MLENHLFSQRFFSFTAFAGRSRGLHATESAQGIDYPRGHPVLFGPAEKDVEVWTVDSASFMIRAGESRQQHVEIDRLGSWCSVSLKRK